MTARPVPRVSVVVPCLNEEDNVRPFYERVAKALDSAAVDWEIVFAMDPCTDRTEQIVAELSATDERVRGLRFSRRFGQPAATMAGLVYASGDAVVVIDCDLQDPPELIPEMIERWREGFDVVYAQRRSREGETLSKRAISVLGYKLIRRVAEVDIPVNTGDFRLMSRRVVEELKKLKETHGFLRGLVGFVGFQQTSVLYDRDPRAGGHGKYNRLVGSMRIGLNGLVGFSRYPLQVISWLGILAFGFAAILGLTYLGLKLGGVQINFGNPTMIMVISFFSGVQLLSLGVMGEYVGRIYDEVRRRPMYIVDSTLGFEEAGGGAAAPPARGSETTAG